MHIGRRTPKRRFPSAALFWGLALTAGCAAQPYRLGSADRYYVAPEQQVIAAPQIERGKPRPVIDSIGWVVGIPAKIVLWDRRIDNHRISCETEAAMAQYLAANELTAVKVRINQYAPCQEWRRLAANKSVAWGWRYTLGTLSCLQYTLLPGRIFGGDDYNPFTNTVNLYSDVPAIAFHEGGHARYWAEREYKGNHAAAYALLPGAPLYYEAVATGDALDYLHDYGTARDERDGYKILYPAYGTYLGSTAGLGRWVDAPVELGLIVGGHIVGRIEAAKVDEDLLPQAPAMTASECEPPPAERQTSASSASENPKQPGI